MLRASWALISLPFLPGARSRLDSLPSPSFLPSSLHLWRHFASSPRQYNAKLPTFTETVTPEVADNKTKTEATIDTLTPSTPPVFRFPPFPPAVAEKQEPKTAAAAESKSEEDIFEPEVADNQTKTEATIDTFTPSMPPVFRFPPFPLAVAEKQEPKTAAAAESKSEADIFESFSAEYRALEHVRKQEPKIAAAAESKSEADIFEPPSAEYRALEHVPTSSAHTLRRIARSLPELLPEAETDPALIFEDNTQDYTEICISASQPVTSTQALELLVDGGKYDDALRVLDELVEVGTEIPFSSSYERAALAAVKARVETKDEVEDQIIKFRKWFSLIPAERSQSSTFRAIRDHIMLSPLNSLRLIVEFGLIAAEKGRVWSTYHPVVSALSMYGDPDVTIQFLDELRRRYRLFLERLSRPVDIEKHDRKLKLYAMGVAVRTFASAGRFDHAIQLIPDPMETDFHFTPYTYNFVVDKLLKTQDPRYLPHIKFVSQHKSERRFRSAGLKKMDKRMLVLAIRCLANEGQLDFAMGLVRRLEGAAVEQRTWDVLLAKLQEVGDGRYSAQIDLVNELRSSITPGPAASSDVAESEEGHVIRTPDAIEDKYHLAIRALTNAWCLGEALSLVPAYSSRNCRHSTWVYNRLLWKLNVSFNPKYRPDILRIQELSDATRKAKVRQRVAEARGQAADAADFGAPIESVDGEDFHLASSLFLQETSQPSVHSLATALRALKKGFKRPGEKPHPLTIVRFLELYLASGRTRAIPMLRKFVLKHTVGTWSYLLAELLFHARSGNPGLVIQTFVAHFFIVGLPRDDLLLHLGRMPPLEGTQAEIWISQPLMKLYPSPVHTAVVWRALLELAQDTHVMENLYFKLLEFASAKSFMASALHPGVPLIQPPQSWKTGVDVSAFTPFIRRMCSAFGAERGPPILRDMMKHGITPDVYQLTELAIAYSREGDLPRTLALLNRAERVERNNAEQKVGVRTSTHVDQVFYVAIIRGFIKSGMLAAAREIERRMFERYGYVAGENQRLDDLYHDLEVAESGQDIPRRSPLTSVVHASTYKALLPNPPDDPVLDLPPETANPAGD